MQLIANENERRLYEMDCFGFIAVRVGWVNIDDLLGAVPGAIIRIQGRPQDCIKFYPPMDAPALGCIAGWVSDEE